LNGDPTTATAAELREWAEGFRSRNPEPGRASPPEEEGRRLATLRRPKDRAEIRITWAEYQGNPYLAIRVWAEGHDGRLWPQKERGFSIRLRELPVVADAIAEALALADEHLTNRPQPAESPRESPPAPRAEFDEFAEGA
jgi:hypothetical protein